MLITLVWGLNQSRTPIGDKLVNLRQLVPVGGRFCCYMEDFSYFDPPCRHLHCLVQWVSPFFFSWPEMWPSHWGWEGCDLIFETTNASGVSKFGLAPNHDLLATPTKAHFFYTTRKDSELLGLGVENLMRGCNSAASK